MKKSPCFLLLLSLFFTVFSFAGDADVLDVKVSKSDKNTYTFDVTVSHSDSGWEHYANKWEILNEKGEIIGTRVLHHPHVNEQPFTRSLSGVKIPEEIKQITVRAHDLKHEYGGKVITVNLP